MTKKKILVYGSLRPDMYNFRRFKDYFKDEIEFVENKTISHYKMYDLGQYPCIVYTDEANSFITVSVLEVSERCYEMIYSMEIGAGYHLEQVGLANTEDKTSVTSYPIFAMMKAPYDSFLKDTCKEVIGGDWNRFITKKSLII